MVQSIRVRMVFRLCVRKWLVASHAAVVARAAVLAVVLAAAMTLPAAPIASAQSAQSALQSTPPTSSASDALAPRSRLVLRFLTDSDFPPFNFLDEEGVLAGFNVDLARAICLETTSSCDIRTRAWDDLLPALQRGEADAVIGSHVVSARALRLVDFTDRYLHTPARFAGTRASGRIDATPAGLDGRRIAVTKDTAHEAYVRTFFRDSRIESFASPELARDALMTGRADVLFDDGIGLGLWLAGSASRDCCEFKGGPFLEPRFFGDGIAIAVPKSDPELRRILNAALKRVRASGRYEEIMQRYFPGRIY
jgi:polar amino acid transport system substrate-binding protein